MIIALTGKIGSGKTTAEGVFRKYNWVVFDCDEIAKNILIIKEKRKTYYKIISKYHPHVSKQNIADNAKLAKMLFSDRRCLQEINAYIAPKVLRVITKEIKQLPENKHVVISAYDITPFRHLVSCVVHIKKPLFASILHIWRRNHCFNMCWRWFLQKGYSGDSIIVDNDSTIDEFNDNIKIILNTLETVASLPQKENSFFIKNKE